MVKTNNNLGNLKKGKKKKSLTDHDYSTHTHTHTHSNTHIYTRVTKKTLHVQIKKKLTEPKNIASH